MLGCSIVDCFFLDESAPMEILFVKNIINLLKMLDLALLCKKNLKLF